jgi:xanthine/uracil/vitamin C permease (AzgA family)
MLDSSTMRLRKRPSVVFFASKAAAMFVFSCWRRKALANVPQEKEIKGTDCLTEIRAGITTFFTMAYIIAVNVISACAQILENIF